MTIEEKIDAAWARALTERKKLPDEQKGHLGEYLVRFAYLAAIEDIKAQGPVCFIPDEVIPMFEPPRIRVLGVPLITYHGENHTPLYRLED